VFNSLNGWRVDVVEGVQEQKKKAVVEEDDSALPF
jgi:hypothetical protein